MRHRIRQLEGDSYAVVDVYRSAGSILQTIDEQTDHGAIFLSLTILVFALLALSIDLSQLASEGLSRISEDLDNEWLAP